MRSFSLALAITLFMSLFASPARSDTITFTDRVAWEAAAGDAQPLAPAHQSTRGLTDINVVWGTPDGTDVFAVVYDASAASSLCLVGTGCSTLGLGGGPSPFNSFIFVVHPLAPVTAFSYDITGTFQFPGQEPMTTTEPTFLGFVFDEPAPPFGLPFPRPVPFFVQPPFGSPQQSIFFLSNIQATVVPEPATLLLFGAAAYALLGHKRRS